MGALARFFVNLLSCSEKYAYFSRNQLNLSIDAIMWRPCARGLAKLLLDETTIARYHIYTFANFASIKFPYIRPSESKKTKLQPYSRSIETEGNIPCYRLNLLYPSTRITAKHNAVQLGEFVLWLTLNIARCLIGVV
jgi:hypothetical protein